MRTLAITMALIVLLGGLGLGTAAASYHQGGQEDSKGMGDGGNRSSGDGAKDNQTRGGQDGGGPPASAQERRQMAMQRAQQAGLFGQLTFDGTADGRFISFDLDTSTGAVSDYTLTHNGTNTTVFDAVTPDPFSASTSPRVHGSVLMLSGQNGHVAAHDNPTALLRIQARNATDVTYDLADGASAEANGSLAKVTVDDVKGTIVLAGNGSLSVDSGTVEAELEDGGAVLFRATPLGASPKEAEVARGLDHAAAQGNLGASVRMSGVNGTPASETVDLGVNATPIEATDGRARVEIGSQNETGKVVHLALDRANINVSRADEAIAQLDGREMTRAASIDDVVNASAADPATAHVITTNSTVEITVWVPSFSLHSLTVKDSTSVPDLPTPTSAPNPTGATTSFAQQARSQVQSQAQAFSQLPEQARQQADAAAQRAHLFGTLDVSAAGGVSGAFVSAQVDANAGTIADYAVSTGAQTVTLVDQVSIDPYTKAADVANAGAAVAMLGQETTTTLRNTPTAELSVKAGSQSVTLTLELPDGVSMERVDAEHVKLSASGQHAHLLVANGNGELALEGDQIRISLGANAQSLLIAHPEQATVLAQGLHERVDAIKDQRVGGDLSLVGVDGTPVETAANYGVETATKNIGTDEVTATVSSQVSTAKAVVLSLPTDLVGTDRAEAVLVTLDGQEIPTSGTAEQALANAGSASASAAVTVEGGAVQAVVNVPGFSDHDVTLSSTDDTDDSTTDGGTDNGTTDDTTTDDGADDEQRDQPFPGVAVLAALLAAAAVALGRRRR